MGFVLKQIDYYIRFLGLVTPQFLLGASRVIVHINIFASPAM